MHPVFNKIMRKECPTLFEDDGPFLNEPGDLDKHIREHMLIKCTNGDYELKSDIVEFIWLDDNGELYTDTRFILSDWESPGHILREWFVTAEMLEYKNDTVKDRKTAKYKVYLKEKKS